MFAKGKNGKQIDFEIFTIYDSKTQIYDRPIFAQNKNDLIRDFLNMMREPEQQQKNKFFRNAEDFSLFKIGGFDKSTGMIDVQQLEHCANLHDLRAMAVPSGQVGIEPT